MRHMRSENSQALILQPDWDSRIKDARIDVPEAGIFPDISWSEPVAAELRELKVPPLSEWPQWVIEKGRTVLKEMPEFKALP